MQHVALLFLSETKLVKEECQKQEAAGEGTNRPAETLQKKCIDNQKSQ